VTLLTPSLDGLRTALEASWDEATAYQGAVRPGSPAFGQCYPTSWLVQQFQPEWEIVRGTVATADAHHTHFWNARRGTDGALRHLDFTWTQFEPGAHVCEFEIVDRRYLGDSASTVARCQLLLVRVLHRLATDRDAR